MGETLNDHEYTMTCEIPHLKPWSMEEISDKLDFTQIKTSYSSNDIVKENEKTFQTERKHLQKTHAIKDRYTGCITSELSFYIEEFTRQLVLSSIYVAFLPSLSPFLTL